MVVRRSALTTPASDFEMMEKAADTEADELVFDLEDAVAPDVKDEARESVIKAIRALELDDKYISVRVSGPDDPHTHRDVIDVIEQAGTGLDSIVVPKVKNEHDVYTATRLVSQVDGSDSEGGIGVQVLIEEVEAMERISRIASVSDRLESLILGFGDYAASQGMQIDSHRRSEYPGDIWHFARWMIIVSARSNGLDAVDGPYGDFSDPDGFREEANRSYALGFDGKWVIHPSQIQLANEIYAPTEEDVKYAKRMYGAMVEAQEEGTGAVQLDGELLDDASIRTARRTLEVAFETGLIDVDDVDLNL